jgi:Rrf2 family protein
MKLSAHEEYGLRCLLRIGLAGAEASVTIPEISQAEGLSPAYTAKLLRMLRRGGFIKSARGKAGGYTLARPAGRIVIGDVIDGLGGRLFESKNFCHEHAGQTTICTRSVDCSVRSLWHAVQSVVDQVLNKTTLQDLLRSEGEMNSWVKSIPARREFTLLQ